MSLEYFGRAQTIDDLQLLLDKVKDKYSCEIKWTGWDDGSIILSIEDGEIGYIECFGCDKNKVEAAPLIHAPHNPSSYISPLVNGNIPAGKKCPWKNQCIAEENGHCSREFAACAYGFSCASARAFDICKAEPDSVL